MTTAAHTISTRLHTKLNYDPVVDFTEYVTAETAQWREAVETFGARVD